VEEKAGQHCGKCRHHSAAGCLPYIFYFLHGKTDEENKKYRAGS
jgi:hypothetical protein